MTEPRSLVTNVLNFPSSIARMQEIERAPALGKPTTESNQSVSVENWYFGIEQAAKQPQPVEPYIAPPCDCA